MRIRYSFEGVEKTVDLAADDVVIGRRKPGIRVDVDLGNDLGASRPHARITHAGGKYFLEDLASTCGTIVDGVPIAGRGKVELRHRNHIRISETTLSVEFPEGNGAGPPPDAGTIRGTPQRSMPPADRLAALYRLPSRLSAKAELDAILQLLLEELLEILPAAQHGAVLLKDADMGDLLLKAHVPAGRPAVSLELAQRAMVERQAFIWKPGADPTRTQLAHQIRSGIYAPLLWRGEALGAICVDSSAEAAFSAEDIDFVRAVAHHAALAADHSHLESELRANTALMKRLLTTFSPKIRDQLLVRARNGRLRLGGERSDVAILESDIRGFTQLMAGRDADEIVELLNDYLSALVEAIFEFDGTIDKFVGDAILAVFGSPEPDARRYEKSIRAAAAMQASVERVNSRRTHRGLVTCNIGIGVHCGEVLHGFVGSADRMEFTIIGDAVNRAARYCAAAAAGEILVSPDLHQRAWRFIDAEPVTIDTKHEGEMRAFRVKGVKPATA